VVPFLHGATAMGALVISLFFLRFWRQARERLFLAFALAFLILAIERVILGTVSFATEWRDYVYLLRLGAFCVILAGILDKNRHGGGRRK
jgi:hypothetical protein